MAAQCARTKSPCRVRHATRGRWAHDVDRHAHGHWQYPRHLYAHTGCRGSAHEVVVRRAANSSATVRILKRATPDAHQESHEIQPFGHLVHMPIALSETTCKESVENLNQLLADTITLRDLYKKHHWQTAGPTFYQLHLLFDKHHEEIGRAHV